MFISFCFQSYCWKTFEKQNQTLQSNDRLVVLQRDWQEVIDAALLFTIREIPGGKAVLGGFTLSVCYICLITVEKQSSLMALTASSSWGLPLIICSPWMGAVSKVVLLGDSPKCFRDRAFWEVLRSLADNSGRGCGSPVGCQAPFLGDDIFLFTLSMLWNHLLGSHQSPSSLEFDHPEPWDKYIFS